MITVTEKTVATLPVLELIEADLKTSKVPLVFFYHGWTGCKEKVLTQGYELAKQGFRVVLPDAYYHGSRASEPASTHQLEFWHIIQHSVTEFPKLVAAYNQVGYDKLGVSGLSMGGITTCALLATYPEIDAAVCLEGCPHPLAFAKQLVAAIPGANQLPAELLAQEYQQIASYDLALQPEKLAGRPLHFWHGTADEMVPYQLTADFHQAVSKKATEKVTMTTSQGVGHKVSYDTTLEMAAKFAQYFKKWDDLMTEKRSNQAIKDDILAGLEEVVDPELGIDIVNLGLVYEVNLNEDGHCEIQMTLTTMGCPLTDLLADMVERQLVKIPEITEVEVKFVWEPAWTMDKMSRYAKMALGIH